MGISLSVISSGLRRESGRKCGAIVRLVKRQTRTLNHRGALVITILRFRGRCHRQIRVPRRIWGSQDLEARSQGKILEPQRPEREAGMDGYGDESVAASPTAAYALADPWAPIQSTVSNAEPKKAMDDHDNVWDTSPTASFFLVGLGGGERHYFRPDGNSGGTFGTTIMGLRRRSRVVWKTWRMRALAGRRLDEILRWM